MNILIINGSPRKKGLISQMLGIMQYEAEKRGDTVQMVYTNDLNIKPCIGCMLCRKNKKCAIAEDDSQRVLKMMQEATLPGAADERQKVYSRQYQYYALALEYPVQTVTRCHPCHA